MEGENATACLTENGAASSEASKYSNSSGGARPKETKRAESTYIPVSSAVDDARLKAQQVADRLRQKYCQGDITGAADLERGSAEGANDRRVGGNQSEESFSNSVNRPKVKRCKVKTSKLHGNGAGICPTDSLAGFRDCKAKSRDSCLGNSEVVHASTSTKDRIAIENASQQPSGPSKEENVDHGAGLESAALQKHTGSNVNNEDLHEATNIHDGNGNDGLGRETRRPYKGLSYCNSTEKEDSDIQIMADKQNESGTFSLTSSTTDVCLADHSSVTETSDSPLEATETCLCLSCNRPCHDGPCLSACQCGGDECCTCATSVESLSSCSHKHCLRNRNVNSVVRSLGNLKHSSSDSEPVLEKENSANSSSRGVAAMGGKAKRKRLSSKETAPERVEERLVSLEDRITDILHRLSRAQDHLNGACSEFHPLGDIGQDLSLNLACEDACEYSCCLPDDQEYPDMVSESSTLHHYPSDTEAEDATFPDSSSEASGDADDEFECDCEHCLRLPLENMALTQMNEDSPSTYSELLGGESAELELDIDEADSLLLVSPARSSMEVLLENMILRMTMAQDLLNVDAPPPAPEDAITSLPTRITDQSLVESELSCPICLVCCDVGDELSCLPCQHLFHPACIRAWLVKSGTCPVCRIVL